MKAGRKPNSKVHDILPKIIEKNHFYTPDTLKILYKKITGEGIGYDTIKRALDLMVKEDRLEATIISKGKKRTTKVYKLR